MKKCKQCGQKEGVHKMSCESKKQFIVFPKLINEDNELKKLKEFVNFFNNMIKPK